MVMVIAAASMKIIMVLFSCAYQRLLGELVACYRSRALYLAGFERLLMSAFIGRSPGDAVRRPARKPIPLFATMG
jgi:hypothetical protein